MNKLVNFYQIKFILKDTVKRMESQAKDWEKIFANHMSDKLFLE